MCLRTAWAFHPFGHNLKIADGVALRGFVFPCASLRHVRMIRKRLLRTRPATGRRTDIKGPTPIEARAPTQPPTPRRKRPAYRKCDRLAYSNGAPPPHPPYVLLYRELYTKLLSFLEAHNASP